MKILAGLAATAATAVASVLLVANVPTGAASGATTAAPDACGPAIYKANGQRWVCTFDDEFSGTTLNSRHWAIQTNLGPNLLGSGQCASASKQNVSVSSGALHLTVRRVATPVSCGGLLPANYTVGSIMTYHLWSQAYGRFTARMMVPATSDAGLHEGFWLWPDDRYTTSSVGEMDIAETFSMYPHIAIPNLHTAQDTAIQGVTTQWNCRAWRGYWNTYTMEWSPHRVTIYMNGVPCLTNTSGDPAFQKREILMLSAYLGQDKNSPNAQTLSPATTLVDYVRVWY